MSIDTIHRRPTLQGAASLLESAALPVSDLTAGHLEHFFFCGERAAPTGLVGVEVYGTGALLRSLVVAPTNRSQGIGSALIERAEVHARALGARSLFLLTTTAEQFFSRRGYGRAARESAPASIRNTREFGDLCPASSVFMVKKL
jgi:amino-acid N-acetyltransferase